VIDHFTWLAPIYEKLISPPEPEDILKLLGPVGNGESLLEAGGGTGRVSGQLTDYFQNVIVADVNAGMLDQTKKKNGVRPVRSHVESLPFPDESINKVLIIDALHHFCDQTRSISESLRVLKPNGKLVIGEPDITKFPVKVAALFEKIMLMRSNFLAPEKIKQVIDSFGYNASITWDDSYSAWITVTKTGKT